MLSIGLFVISAIGIIYLWLTHHYGHWKRKNIQGPAPTLILGNVNTKENVAITLMHFYNEYKQLAPLTGIYLMMKKTLLINDLNLVKNIIMKDYQYFLGHGFTFESNSEPITQNLFNLEGDEWKRMRVKLTPTFTSNKMRMMYDTMYLCSEEMVKYMDDYASNGKKVYFKEIISKFGTDVIASCAFGIQSNSFKDENAEFRQMGKNILSLNAKRIFAMALSLVSPKLCDLIGAERVSKDVSEFFFRVVKETVEYREKNNIQRNDFLQLLIDMKNDHTNPEDALTLVEITAQVFVFFIAGSETSSSTSSFALLELSRNPELMKAVVVEVDQAFEAEGGKITYESLTKMTLLTQVINETLRIYPTLPILFRRCTTDYPVPDTNFTIEKGTLIAIPLLGIHRDPDIYSNPMKFDPNRFSEDNIKNRHTCAHIPFGEGPRICIGSRFGLMQVRLGLAMTLRHFNVELISKVPEVLRLDKRALALKTVEDIVMKLSRRRH